MPDSLAPYVITLAVVAVVLTLMLIADCKPAKIIHIN